MKELIDSIKQGIKDGFADLKNSFIPPVGAVPAKAENTDIEAKIASKVTELENSFTALINEKVKEAETKVTELSNSLDTAKAESATLKSENETLKTENSRLQATGVPGTPPANDSGEPKGGKVLNEGQKVLQGLLSGISPEEKILYSPKK